MQAGGKACRYREQLAPGLPSVPEGVLARPSLAQPVRKEGDSAWEKEDRRPPLGRRALPVSAQSVR